MKGDYDRALRDFDEAVRHRSARVRRDLWTQPGLFRQGRLRPRYRRSRRGDQAEVRQWPTTSILRGFIYRLQGDNDRAIRDLDEAIKLKPKLAVAFSNRGDAWRRRGDIERAIMDLSEAIRLDPAMTPAYVNRGLRLRDPRAISSRPRSSTAPR